ncbi:hypothetical protein FVEN_g3593 [Fusarium venenatum]|uniref:Uncharacterized protein n=1 Tax=Fusarium venenatum TaxID=56646 RepID=A0A2L2SRG6_9HYPO|nr:uncharacterized protein FVRRES_13547 [Fusarium venenatum]KAG8358599.1 hypothetical protein FVEN_g3593 [Fusarium venenatum]KAH6980074.1 hypothetical protein EDB82DRAFT_278122 [Fusarium venenatum]CEI41370.1 unnamed protein product [Fusarium venenatum]
MSSLISNQDNSPFKARRTSSTVSNQSTLSTHEIEYMSLRDENLCYEDDADFHTFIDAMDRVDELVTQITSSPQQEGRRHSMSRVIFSGLKLRRGSQDRHNSAS